MPELPQVQALAERLDALVAGSELTGVAPLQFSALKTFDPAPHSLVGGAVQGVARRGKFLMLDLGGPRILVHLSQAGRIELERPAKTARVKGAVVRFSFGREVSVLVKEYGTQRKAGWWTLAPGEQGPLARLGPEPFDAGFERWLMNSDDKRRLHTALRDQKTVAGIGRGYADDILHRARLSPYTTVAKLSEQQRRSLLDTIRAVLADALEQERMRQGGLPAKLSDVFCVHGRHGSPCPRCSEALQRISYEGYEITYCPGCQTSGRVLADRRLSRIVR